MKRKRKTNSSGLYDIYVRLDGEKVILLARGQQLSHAERKTQSLAWLEGIDVAIVQEGEKPKWD
jgi:hypothetical protein